MVFFNHATRQMTAKIVYYGPGLCGKTTNLSAIYERTSQKARGEMVSLNTETDRTLFFDLLPMEVGVIGGFKAKLQLYTVPGQVFYNSTRKLVLKGVDGIVFVADSQTAMLDANRESIQNLTENLRELGLKIGDIPMVFQWNKRDLKQIVSIEALDRELNPRHLVNFPAIARTGEGVFETLRGISRLALAHIKQLHLGDGAPARPPEAPAPPPPPPPPPPEVPVWSKPTPPVAAVPAPSASPDTHPGIGGTHPGVPTHPGPGGRNQTLPEALSFLDLTPDQDTHPGANLPEALSFLDLSSNLELFQTEIEAPLAPEPAPEPAPEHAPEHALTPAPEAPMDGGVRVMAPLVVKLLPPAPAKSGTSSHPGAATVTSGGMPRVTLRPPSALPIPKPRPVPALSAIPAPRQVLQVALPPDTSGELEVRVQVRRKGLLVAESVTAIAGPGGLSVEFKRS